MRPGEGGRFALDHVQTSGKSRTVTPALFELSGDTLKLCWAESGERPTSCVPADGMTLHVFKRVEAK